MDNDFAVMGMVNKGLGYSLFPKLILRKAPFQLARIELEIPTHREPGIAMRSWDRASMAAKAFVETVRTWVAAAFFGTNALNSMNAGTIWDSSKRRTRKKLSHTQRGRGAMPRPRFRYFSKESAPQEDAATTLATETPHRAHGGYKESA